jgi:hypothetical protein
MSSSPWEWLWNGDEDVATPFGNANGAAMSSAPRERLRNADEDVATPFKVWALSA